MSPGSPPGPGEGALEVTLGKVTQRLAEGDCFAMQLNEPIVFRNVTRKSVRYIVAIATERSRAGRK